MYHCEGSSRLAMGSRIPWETHFWACLRGRVLDWVHWGGKTRSRCEQHLPTGWWSGLNKNKRAGSVPAWTASRLWVQSDQLPQASPAMTSPPRWTVPQNYVGIKPSPLSCFRQIFLFFFSFGFFFFHSQEKRSTVCFFLLQEPSGVVDDVTLAGFLDKRLKTRTFLLRPVPRAPQSNCPGCFLWVLLLLFLVWGGGVCCFCG